MNSRTTARFSAAVLSAALLCAVGLAAGGEPAATDTGVGGVGAVSFQRMAPLAEYLMPDPRTEIELARSAAPPAISGEATVLVLKPGGYETAVKGTNGFTCLVERAWESPFDSPAFWNPKLRGPVCYNPAATRSVLPNRLRRTELALAGHSRDQMLDEIRAALARKELPAPEVGAMSFMMSKEGCIGDTAGPWHPHLMFHVPKAAAATWGANVPGSPVLLDDRLVPEETLFLVPVGRWSDGTEAPTS